MTGPSIHTPRAVRYGSQGPLHLLRRGSRMVVAGAMLAARHPSARQAFWSVGQPGSSP
ncbi:protein of unknown function [Aminobacter niigataensis]|nr:protein of unknown function [Aminobacter niigataensis]